MESETNDNYDVLITVRAIVYGKEAGSIIGKKGDTIRKIKEESRCRIFITDSSCRERILSVTGNLIGIQKAFLSITKSLDDYLKSQHSRRNAPLLFQIIVPSVQCGFIIGKGGSKINELCQISGAIAQVTPDMLPESTERLVAITGTPETVTHCIVEICKVLMDVTPIRGVVIPFRPKPIKAPSTPSADQLINNPLANLSNLIGLNSGNFGPAVSNLLAAMNQTNTLLISHGKETTVTEEIDIPNEHVGCVIGQGGRKIIEIREISGANVQVANDDKVKDGPDGPVRTVSITGTLTAIKVAESLIKTCIDIRKGTSQQQQSNIMSVNTEENSTSLFNGCVDNNAAVTSAYDVSASYDNSDSNCYASDAGNDNFNDGGDTSATSSTDYQRCSIQFLPSRVHNVSGDSKGNRPVRNKFSPY